MARVLDDILFVALLVLVAVIAAFLIFPLIVAVLMAFDARTYLGTFPPHGFSFQWFYRFFNDEMYMRGLKTSLLVATISTFASAIIGVTAAIALVHTRSRARQALEAIFLSPLIVPTVVIGFALLLFFSRIGLFIGFTRLLCGHIIITVPYTIRVTLAGLVGIPKSISEAALSLGASDWRAFWTVTLPLARTNIFAGTIFAFVFSMDDVSVSLFLSSVDTYTLPVAMVGMMQSQFDLSIAAAAVFLMVVMTTLMLAIDKIFGVNKILVGK
jgi:putative spermidine/putrescine transport system permease protein